MPTLVPKAERNAGLVRPSSIATRHSSSMERSRPPYSSGIDRPKRPSASHLVDHVVGDGVVLGDLGLQRAQAFGDEAADGVDQLFAGFGVESHGLFVPLPAGEAAWPLSLKSYIALRKLTRNGPSMDGGDAQAPYSLEEVTEGEWAGWRIWSSDPYELLSGPFYSRREESGAMVCAFRAEAQAHERRRLHAWRLPADLRRLFPVLHRRPTT